MRPEQKLAALKRLRSSDGWALVQEHMEAELLAAAKSLGQLEDMPDSMMHFRRGCIDELQRRARVVEELIKHVELELPLTEDMIDEPPISG